MTPFLLFLYGVALAGALLVVGLAAGLVLLLWLYLLGAARGGRS